MTSHTVPVAHGLGRTQLASYPPGTSFGPRRLDSHHLVWLLTGSATWTIKGRPSVQVRPGTLLLARPGEVDHYQWDDAVSSTHAYLHFTLSQGSLAGTPHQRHFASAPALGAMCDLLLDLGQQPAPAGLSDRVLTLLVELWATPTPGRTVMASAPLQAMLDHVRTVWQRDGLRIVPAAELARAAAVSGGHVFRLFREEFGLGPAEVLELVRLSRATSTLRRSDATVAQVARLCGYENPYHFSRRFSRVVGCPPARYRELDEADPLDVVRRAGLVELAARILDPR